MRGHKRIPALAAAMTLVLTLFVGTGGSGLASAEPVGPAGLTIEAEDGIFTPGENSFLGAVYEEPAASGGKFIGNLNHGAGIAFTGPHGSAARLGITYTTAMDGVAQLYIDDAYVRDFSFSSTGDWMKNFVEGVVEIDMPENAKITIVPTENSLNIDFITLLPAAAPDDGEVLDITTDLGAGERNTVSLNGNWACHDTAFDASIDTLPATFDNTIPVPGLWDMAARPFSYVKDEGTLKGGGNYLKKALWYKKYFTLDGPVPERVTLKINKAFWGTTVYVNGQKAAERYNNLSAIYVDITPYLKGDGERNTLLIKIGDFGSHPFESGYPNLFDDDKEYFIPGIYDDVSLSLSGTPEIEYLQAAPDIDGGTVLLQATLTNSSDASVTTDVTFSVKERDSGVQVVRDTVWGVTVPAGETVEVQAVLDMGEFRLWSPEDPFLYEMEAVTDADRLSDQFGMRKFCFDPETGLPMLNNEVYYLRGTNVAMFRFFEDPQRGDKPWDREWAEKVLTQFKGLNLNSLRFHVSNPPELWYDLCDELGILCYPEYTLWGAYWCQPDLDNGCLEEELTAIIREEANHPSVFMWDAQNETYNIPEIGFKAETGKVIEKIRAKGIDLSNRPWDNGRQPPMAESDSIENHPYLFVNTDFRLSYLNFIDPDPALSERQYFNEDLSTDPALLPDNPRIINEYNWLWLSRDGEPTVLTKGLYDRLFPQGYTERQLRDFYAKANAQLTEFWRAGRKAAGVLEFCGLCQGGKLDSPGDTRTAGDSFLPDLSDPQFDPLFQKMMSDAFAPVGVIIEDWSETHPVGADKDFRVSVINDLAHTWTGDVTLTLYQDGERVWSSVKPYTVEKAGKMTETFTVPIPDVPEATFRLAASYVDGEGETIYSVREFTDGTAVPAPGSGETELSRNKTVTASSTEENPDIRLDYLVDGDFLTRWGSQFSDSEWVQVDLGKVYDLSTLLLAWVDLAEGKGYSVQVSDDGVSWRQVYTEEDGPKGLANISLNTSGRYVRVQFTQRHNVWGYSLWEMKVLGKEAAPPIPEIASVDDPDQVSVEYGVSLEQVLARLPEWVTVTDDQGGLHALSVVWSCGDYDGKTSGTYVFSSDLILPENGGLKNTAGLTARVQVIVEEKSDPNPTQGPDQPTEESKTPTELWPSGETQTTGTVSTPQEIPGTGASLPLAASGAAVLAVGIGVLTVKQRYK